MDEIGKLGFGFMRLPVVEGDGGKEIDIEQVKHMVDLFMDAGFTYFDTARGYHNGRSEAALREAVVERYPRESFQVATKLPAWLAKNADHARAMFDKSLRETGAGYFDFFLLHNLGEERTRLFDDFGLWDFLHEKKEAGLIRNLGFSIHDKAEALEDEGRFRGGRALGGRHDVQTTLLVEMRAGNGGNDAVGVGVLMTKNESGHFEAFLKRG